MKHLLFLLSIVSLFTAQGQDTTETVFETERKARLAVYQIVRHSGLSPNFEIVELDDISTAVAFQKRKKRYIGYNPDFLQRLTQETGTDWSAVSVMAHEIGHHLLGHTLHPPTSFSEELEADKYSGFILYQMGATLEETLSAIQEVGHEFDSLYHPSFDLRQQSIQSGWMEAQQLREGTLSLHKTDTLDATMISRLKLIDDEGNYYINSTNEVFLFDALAQPVKVGEIDSTDNKSYPYQLQFDNTLYYLDSDSNVWNITLNEMVFRIGKISSLRP